MKRDCDKYAGDLSALVDGELTAAWRAEIEAHLAGCERCRARVAQLRKLAAGVAVMPEAAPAPGFLAGVRRKISEGERPSIESRWERAVRSPWVQWPVRIAAGLAIVVGLLGLLVPAFYSRLERRPATETARVEQPEALRKSVRGEASKPLFAPSPAPASPPAIAGADKPVAASEVEAPARLPALDRSEKETSEAAEKIVVTAVNPSEVRARAAALAAALGGRVLPASEGSGPRFFVELPAGQVGRFRQRLLAGQEAGAGERGEAAEMIGVDRAFGGVAATNGAVSVLEIQVVAPAK